jgi:hypothetical protein
MLRARYHSPAIRDVFTISPFYSRPRVFTLFDAHPSVHQF